MQRQAEKGQKVHLLEQSGGVHNGRGVGSLAWGIPLPEAGLMYAHGATCMAPPDA